ncbi:MAG: hypothetical protein AAF446_09575 [Pseudomonadota bacterium]
MQRRWPALDMHFLLDRQAQVELEPSFTYHWLDDTPARQLRPVTQLIEQLQPQLALFDCTGRQQQFKAVKTAGGKLVWLSNRPGKRRKGFRWRTLRLLDLHLILDSNRQQLELNAFERWKLRHHPNVRLELIHGIAPETSLEPPQNTISAADPQPYAVFVSGGGGYVHQGRAVPEIFLEAAIRFQAETNKSTLVLMGPQYRGNRLDHAEVQLVHSLSTATLSRVLQAAEIAVVGAGNMLTTQAMTAGPACVLCAVGGHDQPARVERYQKLGAALAAQVSTEDLSNQAVHLAENPAVVQKLRKNARKSRLRNDTERVAKLLYRLLDNER